MRADSTQTTAATKIWNALRREAHEMASKETLLSPLLKRKLLAPRTLEEALIGILAPVLATHDVSEEACRSLFLDVIRADGSILDATVKDLAAVRSQDPSCRTYAHAFLNYKGFQALQAHRFAHALWRSGRQELAGWLSNHVSAMLGLDIHPAARLGTGIMIDHGAGIVIGETAVVEDDVTLLQNVTLGGTGKTAGDRHPKVRQGVMIGAGANIINNIEIGAFSIVGAGSVVLKDVPANCTMAGAPAQIVRLHTKLSRLADGSLRHRTEKHHQQSDWHSA